MPKENIKIEKVNLPLLNKGNITTTQSDLPIIPHVERVADFLLFAQWFATPRVSRKQKTQKDFADTIGVNQDTLSDWKHNQCFWPITQQFISEWIKERIPDVLNGLYLKGRRKGGAKDVEAFLRLAGIGADPKDDKNIIK